MPPTNGAGPIHIIRFGNPLVHEANAVNGQVVGHELRPDLGPQVTEVHLPDADARPLIEHADDIAAAAASGRTAFVVHLLNNTQSGASPWEVACRHMIQTIAAHARGDLSWATCADEGLLAALSSLHGAPGRPELHAPLELAALEMHQWPVILKGLEPGIPTALKMKAGYDVILGNCFGSQVASAKFMGQTANATAPANTNTTLAEEITTAEGGLIRKECTYAHTTETLTSTLTVTTTANAKDTLPVTVHKVGYFNKAGSGGTMVLEDEVTAAGYNAVGDNVTFTNTETLS